MRTIFREKIYDHFMKNVYPEPNTGCWLWGGGVNDDGYGVARYTQLPMRIITAHRVSYLLHYGTFDSKLHVLHKCDTPCCVNPDHLFLGTHLENIADRTRKGRTVNPIVRGLDNWNTKLSPSIISEIQSLPFGMPQKEISIKYGIAQSHVSRIRNKKTWTWI